MDNTTLQRIALLHPAVRQEVTNLVNQVSAALTAHSEMRIVQGFRTFPEQDALFAQGRTKPGPKVTNAKAGQSFHNYGIAIDFCLLINGKEISWNVGKDYDGDGLADWMEVVQIFIRAGWTWGKAFNDLPHLEKRFGFANYQGLLTKYNAGDFITGTKYLNL